jgi:diguanylate cyclase (GGDEF)-like protein
MLALASALLRLHPVWAVMGFAAATMIYGLRNVLTHLRNLDERDRLERLSQVDELTDLPNRRCFDQTLRREWMRGLRPGNGIAILMIDIDHFKQLNDALGHPEGDIMLRQVANALAGCARRATDLVARYGGEEFVAILSCTDASQANQFAEIMRSSVYELNLPSPVPTGRITISIGVGYLDRIDAYGAERLLAAADEALYEAKRGGRNTVRVHALKKETT